MKKLKTPMNSHTSKSKIGMGDHYGSGIRQKVGTIKRDYLNSSESLSKKYGKPPRSLA